MKQNKGKIRYMFLSEGDSVFTVDEDENILTKDRDRCYYSDSVINSFILFQGDYLCRVKCSGKCLYEDETDFHGNKILSDLWENIILLDKFTVTREDYYELSKYIYKLIPTDFVKHYSGQTEYWFNSSGESEYDRGYAHPDYMTAISAKHCFTEAIAVDGSVYQKCNKWLLERLVK